MSVGRIVKVSTKEGETWVDTSLPSKGAALLEWSFDNVVSQALEEAHREIGVLDEKVRRLNKKIDNMILGIGEQA